MNARSSVAVLAVALSALAADCSDADERREKATFELVPEGVDVVSVSGCGGWEIMAGGCAVLELDSLWDKDEARLAAYRETAEDAGWTVTFAGVTEGYRKQYLVVAKDDYSGTIRLSPALCPPELVRKDPESCTDSIYVSDE